MKIVHDCSDCKFRCSCNAAQYEPGCLMFTESDRPVAFSERIKNFFAKFFA